MAKTFLTEAECRKAENANNELKLIPGKIKSSVSSFRYAINDQTISHWIAETEFGTSFKSDLEKYCNSLEAMADALNSLYQNVESLIISSRRNNQSRQI